MNYKIVYTNQFKKDYKKIKKRNYNICLLKKVISLLISGTSLSEIYKDHSLFNDNKYQNVRECHILSDWLLIYQIKDDVLILVRTGTHSDLF